MKTTRAAAITMTIPAPAGETEIPRSEGEGLLRLPPPPKAVSRVDVAMWYRDVAEPMTDGAYDAPYLAY